MSYSVKFSNQATKFFRKLPKDVQDRIRDKFREVAIDPFRFLEHFEGQIIN